MRKILPWLAALAVLHCATPSEDGYPRLEIKSGNISSLPVGDTTAQLVTTKTTLDARGREEKTDPYYTFTLVSSDTSVAGIVEEHRIVGRKAGTASVHALDKAPGTKVLKSTNTLSVTVAP